MKDKDKRKRQSSLDTVNIIYRKAIWWIATNTNEMQSDGRSERNSRKPYRRNPSSTKKKSPPPLYTLKSRQKTDLIELEGGRGVWSKKIKRPESRLPNTDLKPRYLYSAELSCQQFAIPRALSRAIYRRIRSDLVQHIT